MINNIQDNTFSGSVEGITQEYLGAEFTDAQIYFAMGGFFITIIFFLSFIYLLTKTFINKSCIGCKRLAKCEKEIKEIKQQLIINNYFDKNVFKDISKQIQDIKEELNNG